MQKYLILFSIIILLASSCKKQKETVIYSTDFSNNDSWILDTTYYGSNTASSVIENGNLILTSNGGTATAQLDFTSLLSNNENPDVILIDMNVPYLTSGYRLLNGTIDGQDVDLNMYHNNKKYQIIKGFYVDERDLSLTISDNECNVSINGDLVKFAYETIDTDNSASMFELIVRASQTSSSFATETVIINSFEITVYN